MMLKRLVAGLLVSCALCGMASAQDATGRIDALENQVRALTGQVEELTFAIKQLQREFKGSRQTGQLEEPAAARSLAPERKQAAIAEADSGGIEVIEEAPVVAAKSKPTSIYDATAPEPTVLGSLNNRAADPGDGGYQGQVLVGTSEGEQPFKADDSFDAGQQAGDTSLVPEGIEQVALAQQSPQALFEQSNEALLQRRFSSAEEGFRQLLQNYPDHSLAGSAQYWLGETYFVQGDYRGAAQNFLIGYQKYQKSRRAPDSLVKLGVSLAKLGQRDQACASLSAVATEYPKALEAKRRAQTELKRAGC
jgi:tol-pal system protein YbgF